MDDETPTIYESEAAAQASSSDFKSRVASRLTGVRKTLTSIAKKKTSVVDLDDSSSPSKFRKASFKMTSSTSTKDAVEKACVALATTNSDDEALRTLSNIKGTLRPFLLAQIQQHSLFARPFAQYLEDSKQRALVLTIVLDLTSSPHDLQFAGEVYIAMKASPEFYTKFLEHSGEEDALLALVNIAKTPLSRQALLTDFKDLWSTVLLRWLRHPSYPAQQTLALHLLYLLSQEEANRVSMYADLKPAEKTVMDLVTQHKPTSVDETNMLRLVLLLFSNLAAHRYNAMYMGATLKPVWPALQAMLDAKETPKEVVSAALELMWNLSAVRDTNEVFTYSEVKPLLSSLMDLCRNAKTANHTVQCVLGLWNNLAQIHDNRSAMHNDLKSMWPTFAQLLTKATTADALVLQTLSLLNNLAFAVENQQDMFTLIRPYWQPFLAHITKPRTAEIQSMSVLLLRNLAVASENKPVVFRDMDPVWPTLLDALRYTTTDLQSTNSTKEEMDYGVCHLLWNLSKCDTNRAGLYALVAPVLNSVFVRIEERKVKENVYALLALLKNLAQSRENRKIMAVDLLPHFPVLLAMFDLPQEDVIDDLEVTVWLFQNLASERDNQTALYVALKPITPKLCNILLTTTSEDFAEQVLALWSSLAMGKIHAAWVYVDLEPVRSKLRNMLERSKNRDILIRVLQLYANMAVDERTAVWLYAELSQQLELVCQYAAAADQDSLQEHAVRLLSSFATRALREELISANIVELLQANEENLDCVLALAVLTGGDEARVADWFADDSKVLIVLKVLEDCTVTCEWGYELERPLEALSYLVQVDAMRIRVKVNMVLDAVEVAWKKRDMLALQFAYAVLTQCVGDENNEIRFMGNVSLMETARTLANQDCVAKQQAAVFLSKFPDMGHYA